MLMFVLFMITIYVSMQCFHKKAFLYFLPFLPCFILSLWLGMKQSSNIPQTFLSQNFLLNNLKPVWKKFFILLPVILLVNIGFTYNSLELVEARLLAACCYLLLSSPFIYINDVIDFSSSPLHILKKLFLFMLACLPNYICTSWILLLTHKFSSLILAPFPFSTFFNVEFLELLFSLQVSLFISDYIYFMLFFPLIHDKIVVDPHKKRESIPYLLLCIDCFPILTFFVN